ncbi:hypothetical protein BD289DRAFT_424763 [Coniella lustricola]|uniref:Uncharacterized protein n=1 Tax=Coniella lustricola TaxID=2025994 RepID=A0A2T3AIA5_9PEZI|nr:hypothetical protein BD289DRAFT_424763 [Coniella lustricola]
MLHVLTISGHLYRVFTFARQNGTPHRRFIRTLPSFFPTVSPFPPTTTTHVTAKTKNSPECIHCQCDVLSSRLRRVMLNRRKISTCGAPTEARSDFSGGYTLLYSRTKTASSHRDSCTYSSLEKRGQVHGLVALLSIALPTGFADGFRTLCLGRLAYVRRGQHLLEAVLVACAEVPT